MPSTYEKMALKSKRCGQCNNPVVQTTADLGRSTPFTFSNFLIQYIPKVYFIACRIYDSTLGDAFVEIINTTENEMSITILTYEKEGLEPVPTAQLIPLEGSIELGIKEAVRDELLIIEDVAAFQKVPKISKSAILKCKKNFALLHLTFAIKGNAANNSVMVLLANTNFIVRGDDESRYNSRS